jgi:hypothetical protein
MLRLADAAMYRAKRAGTNGWALDSGIERTGTAPEHRESPGVSPQPEDAAV